MKLIMNLLQQFILMCCLKACLSETNELTNPCECNYDAQIGVIQRALDELKAQSTEIVTVNSEPWQSTQRLPTNCMEAGGVGSIKSDLYRIEDPQVSAHPFTVWCDMETDNGGWLVIQRRVSADVEFNRDWSEYKTGFGNLSGSYWIGLEKLHALTASCEQELYVKLDLYNGTKLYAKYGLFEIGSEMEDYILKGVGNYKGNAGQCDGFHNGTKFSTFDRDNDQDSHGNCVKQGAGGWWYTKCSTCGLNGVYVAGYYVTILSWNRPGQSILVKYSQMMIRPTEKCLKRLSMKTGSP